MPNLENLPLTSEECQPLNYPTTIHTQTDLLKLLSVVVKLEPRGLTLETVWKSYLVSCLGNCWNWEASLTLFPISPRNSGGLLWRKTQRKSSARRHIHVSKCLPAANCRDTGAETLRELGVLPWEETKDGAEPRCCGHALLNTMGAKPKKEPSWCLKPELWFINSKIRIVFPTQWHLLLCHMLMKENLHMSHRCDQSHADW